MINITMKQLRYFDALARERHFGRAADACSVTQPALSMQIQEFEQILGVTLVERTRAGVQLTSAGLEVSERATRILRDTRDLMEFAKHGNDLLTGKLRLGVIPSVAPYMLPPLLPILKAAHANVELLVRETQTDPLIRELINGKLDVLLLALPIEQGDIETIRLFDDPFLLALPKDREISSRVRATPDLIENERLLLLEEGHCLRDQALTYCNLQPIDSVNTFGASSLATIVEMVAAGYGITLLPEMCRTVEARGREIGLMRFAEPVPIRTIGLAWRKTSTRKRDFLELGRLVTEAWHGLIEAQDDVGAVSDREMEKPSGGAEPISAVHASPKPNGVTKTKAPKARKTANKKRQGTAP